MKSILPFLIAGSGLLGGMLLKPLSIDPTPTPTPTTADVLGQCYQADRAGKVALLREIAGKTWPDDPSKAKAWNDGMTAARSRDFKPFIENVLAPAFDNDKLKELADELEKSK